MESFYNTEILPQKSVLECLLVVGCVGFLTSTENGEVRVELYRVLHFFEIYVSSVLFFHPAQVSWGNVFSSDTCFSLPGQAEPVQ